MAKTTISLICGCNEKVDHDRGERIFHCPIHDIRTLVKAKRVTTILYQMTEIPPTLFDVAS